MEDIMNWRKSSYSSSNGGECVEIADHDSRVLVRDTQDRQGPTLRFSADAWRRFADRVKPQASLGVILASIGPRFEAHSRGRECPSFDFKLDLSLL